MAAYVAQCEHSNIKCYASAFSNILICGIVLVEQRLLQVLCNKSINNLSANSGFKTQWEKILTCTCIYYVLNEALQRRLSPTAKGSHIQQRSYHPLQGAYVLFYMKPYSGAYRPSLKVVTYSGGSRPPLQVQLVYFN